MILPHNRSAFGSRFDFVLGPSAHAALQKTIDEQAFLVHVRFEVPGHGLSSELVVLEDWLARDVGQGDWPAPLGWSTVGVTVPAVVTGRFC